MQRLIIDYKKLTQDILILLNEKFPDGYGDSDIITFKNHNSETIDAVEVRTEDTIYLVKIGKHLIDSMANFDFDDDDDENVTNTDSIKVENDSEFIIKDEEE
jgi:hypothetical protein